MSDNLILKRLKNTMKVFAVVQFGLVAMLIYMAMNFQAAAKANSFMVGVIAAAVIQLILFFPIKKFSAKEADRDLTLATTKPGKEEMKLLAKKKRLGEIVKMSTFGFFIIFILASKQPFVLSVIYYSFILTILTYLQCYNFAAKRVIKEHEDSVELVPNLARQKK